LGGGGPSFLKKAVEKVGLNRWCLAWWIGDAQGPPKKIHKNGKKRKKHIIATPRDHRERRLNPYPGHAEESKDRCLETDGVSDQDPRGDAFGIVHDKKKEETSAGNRGGAAWLKATAK